MPAQTELQHNVRVICAGNTMCAGAIGRFGSTTGQRGTEKKRARALVERKSFPFTFAQCSRCMAECTDGVQLCTLCAPVQSHKMLGSTSGSNFLQHMEFFAYDLVRRFCTQGTGVKRIVQIVVRLRALRCYLKGYRPRDLENAAASVRMLCAGQKRFTFTLTLPYNAEQFTIISRLQFDNDRSGTPSTCVCVCACVSAFHVNV